MEREKLIDEFIGKFDEMLAAANAIEDFKWKFSVEITSTNSLIPDRLKTINGINDAFTKNNMSWSSSNISNISNR